MLHVCFKKEKEKVWGAGIEFPPTRQKQAQALKEENNVGVRRRMKFVKGVVSSLGGVAILAVSAALLFPLKHSSFSSIPGMGTQKGSMIVANAIKDIELEKINGPYDLKVVKVGSFWENQAVLIHVLRRFGCMLCRANALELQKIAPILEQNNIRVVAVGIEKLGMEEFLEGGYWKGELYIDDGKKILKALDIKSVGILSSIAMIVGNKDVKDALKKSKHVPGNFKGDGRQLGGTFAIAKGGEMLMDFRQKNFADHPSVESMLEAFGIDASSYKSSEKEGTNPLVCDATCSA